MRTHSLAVCLILTLLAIGCANEPQLRPLSESRVAGEPKAAADTVEGVTLKATADAWRWVPRDLDDKLTPVLVTIENSSDHPLRVRFEEFQLVTPRGVAYAALPPFDIRGEVTEEVSYAYGANGFAVAPHLRGYYPGFGVYGGPFYYNDYYRSYYPVYAEIQLPTNDMLVRALPEGVLEPGGKVTGFLYFAELETIEKPNGTVTLRFLMVNADERERFGVIRLPFRVVQD